MLYLQHGRRSNLMQLLEQNPHWVVSSPPFSHRIRSLLHPLLAQYPTKDHDWQKITLSKFRDFPVAWNLSKVCTGQSQTSERFQNNLQSEIQGSCDFQMHCNILKNVSSCKPEDFCFLITWLNSIYSESDNSSHRGNEYSYGNEG